LSDARRVVMYRSLEVTYISVVFLNDLTHCEQAGFMVPWKPGIMIEGVEYFTVTIRPGLISVNFTLY